MAARHPEPVDEPIAGPAGAVITAPATISVILSCPQCDEPMTVTARLFARMTRDSEGSGALALRTRAAKVEHTCDQPTLGLVEGARSR